MATVDPVKGITGQTIGLWIPAAPFCNAASPSFSITIQGPTLWDMNSSLGPTTGTDQLVSTISTNAGTLQFSATSGIPLATVQFQAIFTGAPPPPILSRSGVFSHIAAGTDWTTVITLVNETAKALPITVNLHNDDGSALALPITTTQESVTQTNTASAVSATVNPMATLLLSMSGTGPTVVGWADVLSTGPIGGFAIFRQTPSTSQASEGTVSLLTQFPGTVTLPYDDTAGFIMGVALANLSSVTADVTATMWDDAGNQLGTQTFTIAGNGHTSFVLPSQIPITAGKRGVVQFQTSNGLTGLGLRFSPFGTFTSVPTI